MGILEQIWFPEVVRSFHKGNFLMLKVAFIYYLRSINFDYLYCPRKAYIPINSSHLIIFMAILWSVLLSSIYPFNHMHLLIHEFFSEYSLGQILYSFLMVVDF